MIEVECLRGKHDYRIIVNGHANYSEYGKDIVCSGVSALYETLIKSIDELSLSDYEMSEDDNQSSIYIFSVDDKARLRNR